MYNRWNNYKLCEKLHFFKSYQERSRLVQSRKCSRSRNGVTALLKLIRNSFELSVDFSIITNSSDVFTNLFHEFFSTNFSQFEQLKKKTDPKLRKTLFWTKKSLFALSTAKTEKIREKNWKKILGFRNMQVKLEKTFF